MKNSLSMECSKHSQQALAVALCKNLSQSDSYYTWSLQAGEARLLKQVKSIYHNFFHLKGGRVPRLALIAEEARFGLLLVGLSAEEQRDEGEAPLSIYLEFEEKDASPVFRAAAALLYAYDNNSYPELLQRFWAYSQHLPTGKISQPPRFELPECHEKNDNEHIFASSEVALPSIRHNRRKCASYIRKLSNSNEFPKSLILISAGRVERDTLQDFADEHTIGELIVLTLSASVQDELDLRSAAERYIPETIRQRIMMSVRRLFSN